MSHILIVEDDLTYATMMQTWLRKKGFDVDRCSSVASAARLLTDSSDFDLVLSDLRLPDHDGLFLLQWMKKRDLSVPFIMMTSYAEVQNAVLAMKSGAADYVAKPVQPDILLQKIRDALSGNGDQAAPTTDPRERPHDREAAAPSVPRYIEGKSEVSRQLYSYVSLVAPTPMSVLILGASGTGKEYVARRIHELSPRHAKPFFALDCGAIPKEVAASEFFGYVKGAFTGATTDKTGAFVEANGGTLFLDEVGNLSYDVQVQLLRALQERRVRPLGSAHETEVDIRLVCATNGDLASLVADGQFREDLYHRINEFTIYMPELKDRGADIFLFADLFIKQANAQLGREVLGLDDKASERLMSYSWPGNLRELNNVMRRATLLTKGKHIGLTELEQAMAPTAHVESMVLHDEQTERQRIEAALRAAGGNKSKAARLLSVDRKTLYNKMKRYDME
ncbi:MAG TPA: sigma-54-dependent Fis family transcriptional regulator [Prevotella sp.]|nr:sigma-54-dependent Fis family transcriptional regulator [Prevotella sp.]